MALLNKGYYKYINTNANEKEVEWNLYVSFPYFRDSDNHIGYEEWESNLEDFFSYFEVPLCPNEAGWTGLLVVERQLY